ncbi:MAG: ribbon-helix-helix protein, CopG family [Firmicutes bacterium]|nr:ribbon-helix-helix protein, CopG family [Bacillota bacterium]
MGETTTIRISREVYNTVKAMARQQHGSMQEIIEQAVKDYSKKKFFADLNSAYLRLKADPKAWAEEEKEREAWDGVSGDGLEDDR